MAGDRFDQNSSDTQATPVAPVKRLWNRGMKRIVVTSCQSPDEQARV